MNDRNDKFNNNICRLLDQSVDNLDADTEFKIGRLKYRALSAAVPKRSRRPILGSVFMAASLLFIVLFNVPQNRQIQMVSPSFTEFDILTAKESLEFYAEDIEFYEWLSEIMEDDPAFMGEHPPLPNHTDSELTSGRGKGRNNLAKSGTDRVSRGIRG